MDKFDKTLHLLLQSQNLNYNDLKIFNKQLTRFLDSANKNTQKIGKINNILRSNESKISFNNFTKLVDNLKSSTSYETSDTLELLQDYIINWENVGDFANKEKLDTFLNIRRNGIDYTLRQVLKDIYDKKFKKSTLPKRKFCSGIERLLNLPKTQLKNNGSMRNVPLAQELFEYVPGNGRPAIGKGEFLLVITKNLIFSKEAGCDLETEGTGNKIYYQVKNLTNTATGSVIECEKDLTLAPRFSKDKKTLKFIFFIMKNGVPYYFVKDFQTVENFLKENKNNLPFNPDQNGGGFRINKTMIENLEKYTGKNNQVETLQDN